VAFRRAMKRAVQSAMRLGAEGIKITCGGRLGGAEIARTEWYREGRVPLHTLRADVDYAEATAHTAYGTCGIKVWIFKGEILEHDPMATGQALMMEAQTVRRPSGARFRETREVKQVMLQPKKTKFRKAFKGRINGDAKGGFDSELRRLWAEGHGAGAHHRPPDRGGSPRDHPPHEASGPRVDPRVPGRAGVEEACRSPSWVRARVRAGILGGARQARPHPVRDRRRAGPLAAKRFRLAAMKLPIKTQGRCALGDTSQGREKMA
jgi:hypothetical protein